MGRWGGHSEKKQRMLTQAGEFFVRHFGRPAGRGVR